MDSLLSRRTTLGVSATTSALRGTPVYIAISPTTTPGRSVRKRIRVPSGVTVSTLSRPDSNTNTSSGDSS